MEFDRQFRPTNRKTEMLMRPTSIMRYFHLATIALTLWKLHVQDLLGSKLTTSSVYTLLPRSRVSSLFSILPLSVALSRASSNSFSVAASRSFYFSSCLCLFFSISFGYSPSLSPLTPDDSSYCRTTLRPPLHPLARYGVV